MSMSIQEGLRVVLQCPCLSFLWLWMLWKVKEVLTWHESIHLHDRKLSTGSLVAWTCERLVLGWAGWRYSFSCHPIIPYILYIAVIVTQLRMDLHFSPIKAQTRSVSALNYSRIIKQYLSLQHGSSLSLNPPSCTRCTVYSGLLSVTGCGWPLMLNKAVINRPVCEQMKCHSLPIHTRRAQSTPWHSPSVLLCLLDATGPASLVAHLYRSAFGSWTDFQKQKQKFDVQFFS